jgi:N-(long-chain-acyl)ethanolamine deacylase
MMNKITLVVFTTFVLAASICVIDGAYAPRAPHYVVDLDAPAETRWSHVVSAYKNDYGPILKYIYSIIPERIAKLLMPVLDDIDKYLPGEYPNECRGVANATGLPLGDIVILNLVYDLTAFCTSILAQHQNGTIFHSRNLDYPIPGLRNLTVEVEFQRNGVRQFECTTFAGYVGCLTGMRPQAFSITVDERDVPGQSIWDNIGMILKGGHPLSFHLRDTLDNTTRVPDFEAALTDLTQVKLIAPVYIILGGVSAGQGAIIARNRSDAADVWRLGQPRPTQPQPLVQPMVQSSNSSIFYQLETNYDAWKPAPTWDDRRDIADRGMNAMGQAGVSNQDLYNVLSMEKVLNSGTKYTTQMVTATGYYQSYVRWDAPADVPYAFHLHRDLN